MGEQNETRESTYFPTNEENLALIKKIRKGKRAERKFLKSIDLKEEEKNRLLKSIREGNEAQNKILDINRSFV